MCRVRQWLPDSLNYIACIDRRRKEGSKQHGVNILPVGSLVRITSYSPFRGLRGIIRTVDTIFSDLEEPFCFYLVALEGAWMKEPVWFEYQEVEEVTAPLAELPPSSPRI